MLCRRPSGSFPVTHVDDVQAGEVGNGLNVVIRNLSGKFEMKIEGPFLTPDEYAKAAKGFSETSIRFLKGKFVYVDYTLRIAPDPKYLQKLEEALKIKSKGKKPQTVDDSKELDSTQSALYRKCVGILLCVAQDRPDSQFSIRGLSSKMSILHSRPTSNLCAP